MATDPVTFFLRINLPKAFQPLEAICLDNGKTKERLLAKMEKAKTWERREEDHCDWESVLLISRYPLASTKQWIVENEKEVLNWYFANTDRAIFLIEGMKVVAI
jgi:hypothetical protein